MVSTFIVLVSFLVSACSEQPDTPLTVKFQELAIQGYDPVSYFTESNPVEGVKDHEYVWNGIKFYFSSTDNLELFRNNPEKYAPQFNGYCAFALSRDDYVATDPRAFAIVNDRLYMLYNLDIKNAWLQDKENYISMAEKNWRHSQFNNQ